MKRMNQFLKSLNHCLRNWKYVDIYFSSLNFELTSQKNNDIPTASPSYQMLESRVPSTRLGRLWQYGGLATSMAFGAVGETLRRATGSKDESNGSVMFSAGNMERLVAKLSKMRGAALKLGQMMSLQGQFEYIASSQHYSNTL
jgi:hypothetical protein